MSASDAVNRQLKKGGKEPSTEQDAEVDAGNIAKAVVRYWGTHAAEVLRHAAQLAEEMDAQ